MLKLKLKSTALFVGASLVSLNLAACKQASYEIIQGKKKIAPTAMVQNGPAVTANVETLRGTVVAAAFSVNEEVGIRPTADTADLDDVGKTQCANPGIVSVTYTISDGTAPITIARPTACEPPSTTHQFATAGTFTIKMTVVTNDKETAEATTSVTIACAAQNPCGPGQNPGQNNPGQN
jgi:hypothetical protein